ncbi:MAG: hypothetical protein DMG05_27055 [Acidobacteria bacterium]|nr:MAG: hypothetical protein DMG05_27055 [Acidobacteriota bacterium]
MRHLFLRALRRQLSHLDLCQRRSQSAHIEGAVLLEAVIAKSGSVENLRLMSRGAHPFLVKAAMEAVKQWRYQPTLLNGEPIEVVTTITVDFRLAGMP